MFQIYLIRQADPKRNNTKQALNRNSQDTLSELGKMQAKALCDRFYEEGVKFTQVYSAQSSSAVETTKILCAGNDYPIERIITVDALRERELGIWEGKDRADTHTTDVLKQMNKSRESRLFFKPSKGESYLDVRERAYGWLRSEMMINRYEDQTYAIVSHRTTILCILQKILDIDPRALHRIRLPNASISTIFHDTSWGITSIGDSYHTRGLEERLQVER